MPTTKKTSSKDESAPNAIELLKADHKTVRELLSDLEETTDRGVKKREDLLAKISAEVQAHATIEEEIFYPAFHEAAETKEQTKLFFEATEEHALVHIVLPALEETDPSAEEFGAKAKVLKDLIEHHAEEEEEQMFPAAKRLLGREKLVELGAQMQARKEELLAGRPGSKKASKVPARAQRR